MSTTVDTAEIAANVCAEIAAMPDRLTAAAVHTARELKVIRWTLGDVTYSRSATTVTIRFQRGDATTASGLASALFDRACEHLPVEQLGEIVDDGYRTFTLKF